jgi:predicted MFS family arabinose efflux permease
MAITSASNAIDLAPSRTSLSGLDGINFFLAGMQAGFGLFLAVLLADEKWTQQNIGYVLSVGGLAGLLSQLPSGELLDASRSKRLLAFGAIVVAVSALVMAGDDRHDPKGDDDPRGGQNRSPSPSPQDERG